MLKRAIILVVITALIAVTGLGFLWFSAPEKIENEIHRTLANAGFEATILPAPKKRAGEITYENIKLDTDGFSTIQSITLSYTPFSFLTGSITSLDISGIELTGELNDNGTPTIAGWNADTNILTSLRPLKLKTINIEKSRISLLSEKWGGITLKGDAQLRPARRSIDFQANLKAEQKQLNFSAKIDGKITDEGFWHARAELEQGKLILAGLRASRLAGIINANGKALNTSKIVGELQAGGLSILETPWKNGAITIDGDLQNPRMIIAAKSIGVEGVELGLTIPNLHTPTIFSGEIHNETLTSTLEYLKIQNQLPLEESAIKNIKEFKDLVFSFQRKENLTFSITNEENEIDVRGIADLSAIPVNVQVSSAPMPLHSLFQQHDIYGLTTLNSTFSQSENQIHGNIDIHLNNAGLNYGVIPLKNINNTLNIENIKSLSGSQNKKINCAVSRLKADHQCHIAVRTKNGRITFNSLEIKSAGISLHAPKAAQKTFLLVKTIDLKELFESLNVTGWDGTGLLEGTLTLERKNDVTSIKNIHINNMGIGILKIKAPQLLELIQMEDLERETMKLALENFHYDLLEIKGHGELPGSLNLSIFGKGKNPYLLQGREFSIDFEISPDTTTLLNTFLEN